MAELNDVMLSLGRVLEAVEGLRADVTEVKSETKSSLANIHRRIDDQVKDIGELTTKIEIAGKVEAQVRDEVKALKAKVNENQESAQPVLDDMRRLKAIGLGVSGLLAIAGLSVMSVLMWAGETFWQWLRHMLRIP